jgi:transposase
MLLPDVSDEDWDRTPESVKRLLIAMAQRIAALEEEVRTLREENLHLREQLGLNSHNSSNPPSSDPPGTPVPDKKPTGRKRGGQPGHTRHIRPLIPPEDCKEVIPLIPTSCKTCGNVLRGEDPAPQRRQVIEIPEIEAYVTEYQLWTLRCERCHAVTQAQLPPEAHHVFGPRLQALIAVLNGVYHLTLRQIQAILGDLFRVSICVGHVDTLRREAAELVAPRVEEVRDYVQTQTVVNADETGFRQGNADGKNPHKRKAWLWVAVTPRVVAFIMTLTRGTAAAKRLLGEPFTGIVGSDRWHAYTWIELTCRQLCWSHLIREFERIAGRGGASERLGVALLDQATLLFTYWHRVRDGTLKWSSFKVYVSSIRQRIRQLLTEGAEYCPGPKEKSARAKTARTCKELLHVEAAMWTFVRLPDVEPTNNAAERAIRPAVIWRKLSYGTESAEGSEFVARMLTVVMTLKVQGRGILAYMTHACTAARRGEQPPSLLPDRTLSQQSQLPITA